MIFLIRSITGSLAIEGNTLTEEQITALLDGKLIIAPPREIQEAKNALDTYEQMLTWNPMQEADLLAAHKAMMLGLIDSAGLYHSGGVGVFAGKQVLDKPATRSLTSRSNLYKHIRRMLTPR